MTPPTKPKPRKCLICGLTAKQSRGQTSSHICRYTKEELGVWQDYVTKKEPTASVKLDGQTGIHSCWAGCPCQKKDEQEFEEYWENCQESKRWGTPDRPMKKAMKRSYLACWLAARSKFAGFRSVQEIKEHYFPKMVEEEKAKSEAKGAAAQPREGPDGDKLGMGTSATPQTDTPANSDLTTPAQLSEGMEETRERVELLEAITKEIQLHGPFTAAPKNLKIIQSRDAQRDKQIRKEARIDELKRVYDGAKITTSGGVVHPAGRYIHERIKQLKEAGD